MSVRHWKLFKIVFIVAKLGNICFGRKSCVRETKMFLTLGKSIFLFPSSKICFRNICFRRGKTGKHLPPQQCLASLARP